MYVCLHDKVHTVKMERCACTVRPRGGFTEAAHDSQVTNPFSNLTIVCRLAETQQQAHSECTWLVSWVTGVGNLGAAPPRRGRTES